MSKPDPKITARLQEVFTRVDAEADVVLKGHLLIEERLNAVLEKFVFHPEILEKAGLRFHQKVQLARSISVSEHESEVWAVILAFNALRNDLAHALSSTQRAKKREVLIETYSAIVKKDHPEDDDEKWESHVRIVFAAAYCCGFLEGFERDVGRLRLVVDSLSRGFSNGQKA